MARAGIKLKIQASTATTATATSNVTMETMRTAFSLALPLSARSSVHR